jgi:hypothetical protein
MTDYKRAIVYTKVGHDNPWSHMSYPTKDAALEQVRGIKSTLKVEPTITFLESDRADIVHFKFPGTGVIGRIVLMKQETEQYLHCQSCGNALRRDENNKSSCHSWECDWEYDYDNGVWRVETLTRSKEEKW